MSEYINNPSKEELKQNLNVVAQIEKLKVMGYEVVIEDGMVY